MVWSILASKFWPNGNKCAVVEKDGDKYFLVGDDWEYFLRGRPTMNTDQVVRVNRLFRHDPPTVIEKIEDWPAAAKAFHDHMEAQTPVLVYIIASGKDNAILEKDQKFYNCLHRFYEQDIQDSDLVFIEEWEIDIIVERDRLVKHDPKTQIRKVSDWPAGHRVYRRRLRTVKAV